jgi:hypothetical protein
MHEPLNVDAVTPKDTVFTPLGMSSSSYPMRYWPRRQPLAVGVIR